MAETYQKNIHFRSLLLTLLLTLLEKLNFSKDVT